MKFKTLLLLFFTATTLFAQESLEEKAKSEFTLLQLQYDTNLQILKDSEETISKSNNKDAKRFINEIEAFRKAEEQLKQIKYQAQILVELYVAKGLSIVKLDSFFSVDQLILDNAATDISSLFNSKSKTTEPNKYLMIGSKKAIKMNDTEKENAFISALGAGLNEKSDTHFGTFIIPADRSEIIACIFNSTDESFIRSSEVLKFKSIDIDLAEGSIIDVRVYLYDNLGKVHLFTNKTPISFLNFDKTASLNYIFYSNEKTKTSDNYKNLRLRLSDVLTYKYAVGNNYVPDHVTFSFPLKDLDGKQTNLNAPASYDLIQSTALSNIIDFRAYTDVFALSDSESNGLASFEAQAEFFLNTRNFNNGNAFAFKKIRPYFSFSRFEEEDKLLEFESTTDNSEIRQVSRNLDIIQKSSFKTGVDIDLITFKFKKENTFETSLFFTSKYQTATFRLTDNSTDRYSLTGLGAGLRMELKRFSNFSLVYTIDLINYKTDGVNDFENINDTNDFVVFGNQFELSWYPVKKKNNSFFARFRTFNDISINSDAHFFQAEVGYRFTLNVGKVNNSE